MSSDEEAKQCLMQKKRQISRHDAPAHPDNEPRSDVQAASLAQSRSDKHGESALIKHSEKASENHDETGHDKSNPSRHHKRHHKKDKNHVKSEEKPSHHKAGASHQKHDKKRHHKSRKHKKPEAASLAQLYKMRTNGTHTLKGPDLKALLPEPVMALAWKLFKTEGAIAGCVENSVLMDVTYAGVKMSLRLNKFDDATKRVGEEAQWFGYDLDTLDNVVDNSEDMLNMIDLGGNYGVVTIAAMKKYAKKLRVIAVEPSPETFFFLTWNLHLNGIPVLDESAMREKKGTPGVLALNSGSADVANQDLHFCSYPWSSMNSKVCDCPAGEDNCHIVPSVTVDHLASMFGTQPIALVKMDCEGCEFKSLPALAMPEIATRVRRLAGELHLPDKTVEELACRWDHGRLLSKCQRSEKNSEDIECNVKLSCPE